MHFKLTKKVRNEAFVIQQRHSAILIVLSFILLIYFDLLVTQKNSFKIAPQLPQFSKHRLSPRDQVKTCLPDRQTITFVKLLN
jgi:hypothetical protein